VRTHSRDGGLSSGRAVREQWAVLETGRWTMVAKHRERLGSKHLEKAAIHVFCYLESTLSHVLVQLRLTSN
jgi:hypothetical protein